MSEQRHCRTDDLIARVRAAARQEQFLEVVSAEEARARFERHLDLTPLAGETRAAWRRARPRAGRGRGGGGRCAALRPLQCRRLRRARRRYARRQRRRAERLTLNAEVIACGDAPALEVAPGTATAIATGGVIPRGADAIVMIEHTD